jgi:hypothetical protein
MTDQPRLLSGIDAAAYLSVTPATFSKWVAAGTVPPPVPATRRWDRKAIDLALDKASGIVAPSIVPDTQEAAEDEWERKYAARKGTAGTGDRK